MDENKAQKLRDLNYRILRTCSNCKFGNFKGREEWSTCRKHYYRHKKHTESVRDLSIHKSGYCTEHEWSNGFDVGLYKEFVEGGKK